MARRRIIGVAADERTGDQYRFTLERDLGKPNFGRPLDIDGAQIESAGRLARRPLAVLLIVGVLLAAVVIIKLWRDGAILPPRGAPAVHGGKGWMLGDKRAPVADKEWLTRPDPAPATPPVTNAAEAEEREPE